MSRILDAIRDAFIALAKDPWLAAPAAALTLFSFLAGYAYSVLPLPAFWMGHVTFLVGALAAGAAAAAYSARLEPYARFRAVPLALLYAAPMLALGVITLGVGALAERFPASPVMYNMLSGYGHLHVIAGGLLLAVAARAIRPLAEGDPVLSSWREGFGDVAAGFQLFALLAVFYWLAVNLIAAGLPWPIGPILSTLLAHTMMIGGARRL